MYTQFAETLWTNITKHVSDIQFRMTHTILGLQTFNKTFSARKFINFASIKIVIFSFY